MTTSPELHPLTSNELDCFGSKRQAELAREHIAQMTPERRALLEREWDDDFAQPWSE